MGTHEPQEEDSMAGGVHVDFVGNLTNDPELRFTPSGAAVANFTVAVNERVKNDAGEWEDGDATFYRCAVWREMAENVAESLQRGQRVMVSGTQKLREYDITSGERAGQKGASLEVTVDEVGPSLRWATARVEKAGKRQGSTPAKQPPDDPWGSAGGSDEPPF